MKIVIIMLHCKLYCKDIIQNQSPFFFGGKSFRVREKKAANDESKSVWTPCLKGTPTKGKSHSSPDGLSNPVLYFYLQICIYIHTHVHIDTQTHQKCEELGMNFK